MVCGNCGTSIADKAIVCYRCGASTAIPAAPVRPGKPGRSRSLVAALLLVVALTLGWFGVTDVFAPDVGEQAMGRGIAMLVPAAVLLILAARLLMRRR